MLQVVLSLPVLSSDDDSDHENSGSGDERKRDRRASPPSVTDGGAVLTPDSHGGVPTKDGGSASEGDAQGRAAPTTLPQGQQLLFTTTDFYLVLRMHHLLAERLAEAKKLCREAGLSRQTVVASPQEVGWVEFSMSRHSTVLDTSFVCRRETAEYSKKHVLILALLGDSQGIFHLCGFCCYECFRICATYI